MRIAFTLTVLPQVVRNFKIYFGFATARYYYGYFGREGLSGQWRFSSQTQIQNLKRFCCTATTCAAFMCHYKNDFVQGNKGLCSISMNFHTKLSLAVPNLKSLLFFKPFSKH